MKKLILLYFWIASFFLNAAVITPLSLYSRREGDSSKPVLFLVHGSPGSSEQFLNLLNDPKLRKNFYIVAVDRPGHGKSSKPLQSLSVEQQADVLADYLKKNFPDKKIVLLGHSYGAPVAGKMATRGDLNISSLILTSPIGMPDDVRSDRRIKALKAFDVVFGNTITPNSLASCQGELLLLEDNLVDMLKDWEKIRVKTTFVNGDLDTDAKASSAKKISQRMNQDGVKTIVLQNAGHNLIEKRSQEIVKIILEAP